MAVLNEYCLYHINTFLQPHDWVQVSRVCKLWERATLRNWKKITVIEYLGALDPEDIEDSSDIDDRPTISSVDAGKMVLCAAPFVKILRIEFPNMDKLDWINDIKVGAYPYQVTNFFTKNILKLMAKKSTELTEVRFRFDDPPEADLVRPLFERNKIVDLSIENPSTDWCRHIPTQTIEDLFIDLYTSTDLVSFEGLFPNLKTFRIHLNYKTQEHENSKNTVTQMLPYVPRLTSLFLLILLEDEHTASSNAIFSEVIRLSELEELTLALFCNSEFECPEFFLDQLSTCCPKLRALSIKGSYIRVNQQFLSKILSLPRLESLEFELPENFSHIELPKIEHLSKLHVIIRLEHLSFTSLFDFVKKMPRLKKLLINDDVYGNEERLLSLVCGVIEAATSFGKNVLLSYYDNDNYRKILITKLSSFEEADISDESNETMHFRIKYKNVKMLFEGVKKFVRNKLYKHNVFVSEE